MIYAERMGKGLLAAVGTSLFTAVAGLLFVSAAKVPFIRKWLPTPGNGPSRETMEGGYFSMSCYALSEEVDGREPVRVKSFIKVCLVQLLQHKINQSRHAAEGM